MKVLPLVGSLACVTLAATSFAADAPQSAKPVLARICTACHSAAPGSLMGYFDNVAFKSKTIQLKMDDRVELLKFDEDDIKVVSSEGKQGDGELLKKTKKGHEIRIYYTENNGVKTATKLVERPPAKVPHDMLISTAELEKLVAAGPSKGKYFLYDSRPASRFREGAIPTAANLPFSSFDMMTENLPKDKNARIIFYDTGPDCIMSSDSAVRAQKLGYTNIRVYRDGMPGWVEKQYGILLPSFLNDAFIDKNIPHVLLDVRTAKESGKGFIPGAVSFPAKQTAKLVKGLDVAKSAPVIVYDQKGGKDSAVVAAALIKAGFRNVLVLTGGYEAWQAAKYESAVGRMAAKASYVPQPRPGEINLDEFRKYADARPANVVIIDVRNPDESKKGMLKNAILIPAEEIKERSSEIPRDKLIITHCASGVRAEMAYHTLRELGYTTVKFVNAKFTFDKDGTYQISKD